MARDSRGKKNAFVGAFVRASQKSRGQLMYGWKPSLYLSFFLLIPHSPSLIFFIRSRTHIQTNTYARNVLILFNHPTDALCAFRLSHFAMFPVSTKFQKSRVLCGQRTWKDRVEWSHGEAKRPLSMDSFSEKTLSSSPPSLLLPFPFVLLFLYLRQRSHLGNIAAHLK